MSVAAPTLDVGLSVQQTSMITTEGNSIVLRYGTNARFARTDSAIFDLTTAVATIPRKQISIVASFAGGHQTIPASGLRELRSQNQNEKSQTEHSPDLTEKI